MARPSDARSRIIRTASALFRQRGYDGVGLTEILEVSGAPKGSFYHHFPEGKEQLAQACMLYAGEQTGAFIDATMAAAPDFPSGMRQFAAGIADWFERSGFCEGCPITSIALATAPQSRPLTETARAVFDDWQRRLLAHSSRLGTGLSNEGAELLLMLVEGAWILGRIQHSKEPLLRAIEVFLAITASTGSASSRGQNATALRREQGN
ncbi:MAG: TetR/AcrR family transcriptional regulator [Rhodomicrobium sp.]